MKISRGRLLDVLLDPKLESPRLRKQMAVYDVGRAAAILLALARIEGNFDLEAQGDLTGDLGEWVPNSKAESFGLWQINAPTWFPNGLPKYWELLGTQLGMVAANWADANRTMRVARKVFGVKQLPIEVDGTIVQIGWQYGGPRVRKWLATKPNSFTPRAFTEWLGTTQPWQQRARDFDQELAWAAGEVLKKTPEETEPGILKTSWKFWWKMGKRKLGGPDGGGPEWMPKSNLNGWIALVLGVLFLTRRK